MNKKKSRILLVIIPIFLGLLFIFFPYDILKDLHIGKWYLDIPEYDKLATFIGGITAPCLSVSAFVLLYLTYKSQSIELLESRTIQVKQSSTLEKQQFETTFFNMLNLQIRIVDTIDLYESRRKSNPLKNNNITERIHTKGRDCFVKFYIGYKNLYRTVQKKHPEYNEEELISQSFLLYYKKHQSDLGHYFRNLYHIFKFIKQSTVKDKRQYASLVRAQLSSHELLILFYDGLSPYGGKFKLLMEEFQILKSMPSEDLILETHEQFYKESAFQK